MGLEFRTSSDVYDDTLSSECNECDEPLSGRNLPLEEILLTALFNEPKELIILDEDEKKKEESVVASRKEDILKDLGNVVAKDCYVQMLGGGRYIAHIL